MKDRTIIIILALPAPVAFVLTLGSSTSLGYPRSEPFYFMMTFAVTYYLMIMLGIGVNHWLSKGGTVQKQLKKTFRLKKLDIKRSGFREFFRTDFTIPERLNILSILIGLTVSLGAWHLLGRGGYDLPERVGMTFGGFFLTSFGIWYLTADISIRFYKETAKQSGRKLKTLDLESSKLAEFSFDDIPNLDRIQRISLEMNELSTIDLTPLAGSRNLIELILYMNRLESIDLSPLSSCPNLEYLDLADNNLETIDLTPLSSCTKLTALNLGGNETSTIDLNPLSDCRDLKILTIDNMKLKEVDLSPLEDCNELEFLKLNDNEIESLDITPLIDCAHLTDFEIDGIDLTTTLIREVEDWPEGVRKHKRRFRKI